MSNKTPSWMAVADDAVTVTLTRPSEANGVTVGSLRLRAPTVRDVRSAQKTGDFDDEQRELNLFASLAEVGQKDLEALTLKDYTRLQAAYFRLVREDEV